MNHCFDCNSSYAVPGTCNCFAPGGKRAPRTGLTIGTAPGEAPTRTEPQPGAVSAPWVTLTPCKVCGKQGCTETHVVVAVSDPVLMYGGQRPRVTFAPPPGITLTGGIDRGGNCAAIQ